MGTFGRHGGFGGHGNKFGGGSRNRGFGDKPRPQMHQATCDKCGSRCEVPFRPTGDRPVFCQECFRKEGPPAARDFGGRQGGRPNFEEKRMFEATCDKCGSRCEVPFRPTGEKPVYCRACFGKNDGPRVDRAPDQFKAQLDLLNTKLDKILRLLGPDQPKSSGVADQPKKEAVLPKAKKAPLPEIAVEAKPAEAVAIPKVKKAAGKKAPAKKAAKSGK